MYGLTLVFSQKRRRSVGLRFLCSVHLITSTRSLAVVCNTVCLHHRLACLLSDCCGRRSHLGSSRVWCVSFNDSQCHWETCTAIWIYRWLDRRSGRGLAGFWVVVLPRGIKSYRRCLHGNVSHLRWLVPSLWCCRAVWISYHQSTSCGVTVWGG